VLVRLCQNAGDKYPWAGKLVPLTRLRHPWFDNVLILTGQFCGVGIIFAAAIKLRFDSLAGHREEKIAHSTKNPSTTDSTPLPDVSLCHARGMGNPTKKKGI
jgi:hypothetical protein